MKTWGQRGFVPLTNLHRLIEDFSVFDGQTIRISWRIDPGAIESFAA